MESDYERFLNFIGMIYESFVIIIAVVLVILIILRYREKKHELTLYLLIIFCLYLIAIIFSWLSKVFVVARLDLVVEYYNFGGFIFYRIMSFRVSEFLVCIALYFSYILKVKAFHDEYNKLHKYVVIIYGVVASIFVLGIYRYEDDDLAVLFDVIAFFLVLIYMMMIYIPFMISSIGAYKAVEDRAYKIAFLALGIMAISFTLIFLNFLIDRIFILIFDIIGFTLFYYMAWAFTIVGITGAYFGYIRPKAQE